MTCVRMISATLVACVTLSCTGLWLSTPASAQVLERGVEGGAVGAIIGGIVGGGRGAGTGAAIGASVGVLSGAAEADANARARAYYGAPPPPSGPGPRNLVFSVQSSLNHLGYDVGPPDGVMGPRTAQAISQYQYANRLPVDGQPSPELLNYMIRQGG